MQTFIDFLVNNYLWFIIIALILVFALIGYLVDTSEKAKAQEDLENEDLKEAVEEPMKEAEPIESLNMDMGEGIQELEKEAIPIPNNVEAPTENNVEQAQPTEETTEVLEDLE